jgi:hypothetical protein
MPIRRKCFISYHHADQAYVDAFIKAYDELHDIFIARQLGSMPEDVIDSMDSDYVMGRIRSDYIKDSTVTILLVGRCTWARRYVDWEIQSSLRSGSVYVPNGLLGIKLPTFTYWPERFNSNLQSEGQADCYGRWLTWENATVDALSAAIEAAFMRRTTHLSYITNPRARFTNNKECV